MGISWMIENPASSCILLHPWLQWAIRSIQRASGQVTSIKLGCFQGSFLIGWSDHNTWSMLFFTILQRLEFVHFWGWTVASEGIQSEVLDAQLPIAFYEANHGDHEPASPKGSWCGSSPLWSKETSKKGDTAIQRQYWQNQICWHKVFEVISES